MGVSLSTVAYSGKHFVDSATVSATIAATVAAAIAWTKP